MANIWLLSDYFWKMLDILLFPNFLLSGTITETAVSTIEEYDSSIILLQPRSDLPSTGLEALVCA